MTDLSSAGREILWNVSGPLTYPGMYGLFAVALLIGLVGIWRQVELVSTGRPYRYYAGDGLSRFARLFVWGVLQRGVVRDRRAAYAHTLIYTGFLVLLFTTTMVAIDHDLNIPIYYGRFYLAVTVLSDLFGLAVLIGCLLFGYRRYIKREDMLHNTPADALLLGILILLIIQGYVLEGLRIHVTSDRWAAYSPVGLAVAGFFWPLSETAARALHLFTWWFHAATVFLAVAVAPYSKFFHILASTANLYMKDWLRPKGRLESTGDIEKLMEESDDFTLGLGTIKDYSWKALLDLEACTSCGRCQDACPAYLSGKPLSPKWIILDTRNHARALHVKDALTESKLPTLLKKVDQALETKLFLNTCGLKPSEDGSSWVLKDGIKRADNIDVQNSFYSAGKSVDDQIAGSVINTESFWSCTTCMACVEACPVGINHVDQIVGNRRNMVLMRGEMPSEAQGTLRALENRANPYGPPEDRAGWLSGLDVPVLKPGDSVDYLYWVGCVSAYDPRKQKIAQALVKLMKHAGLSFGVLGNAEGCSGDPARRLGEENLYQTLAKSNIETLKSIKFKTLVANCPHCFNTIKNEYPEFGNLGDGRSPEIIHHSVLLKRLIKQGKLKLKPEKASITFHDPCYLGRYNDEYDAPREALRAATGQNASEMARSRNKALCCGAGGGHFWFDMKKGERINTIRVNEAAETGASCVATACPFCMQMIEDGIKITDREEKLSVKDIAEIVLERLEVNS
ncbi:MAG: 4Fe-4S dicluster domain-containing protein [Candidatus Dadabacteria bacterium]|nr:MAG: 4Fe-4S dicluster domain-containing protein [Candidatus Dadabacteria bacterium]